MIMKTVTTNTKEGGGRFRQGRPWSIIMTSTTCTASERPQP